MNSVTFSHQTAVLEEASNRAVYQTVVQEFEELPEDQLLPVNIDPSVAVLAVVGALPRIVPHRDALATLPGFDIARFDKLETYARALTHAHRVHQIASEPPDDLKSLQEEASQLRDLLHRDASVAIGRNLMPQDAIDDLKGANGYRNTANDLDILVTALQANWSQIEGKVGATAEELAYAEKLSFHLLRVFGIKENGPEGKAAATEMRNRAFTLFLKTYEEVRQGLAYLRRDTGDVDKIAPSIYLFRQTRKKGEAEAEPSDEPTQLTATPTAPTQTPPVDGAPSAVNPSDPYA